MYTSRQKTTDGREYVAVFDDPNSTAPTHRYVYAPDGSLESEQPSTRNAVEDAIDARKENRPWPNY